MNRFIPFLYLGTVFLTGAAVLIIEVSAVRLLSIQFGASLAVLSGVLSIILLSLSCGYYVGGKISDRWPSPRLLYTLIGSGGIVLLILSTVAYLTLYSGYGISNQLGPLLYSTAFFFLPALILGVDSPFVITLLQNRTPSEHHGSTVGAVFFWSTLGSIVGSLATGFVLIPYLGLQETLTYTSLGLVILGALGYLLSSKIRNTPAILLLVLLIVSTFSVNQIINAQSDLLFAKQHPNKDVLYSTDGLYSQILIYEAPYNGRTARFLQREVNHSSIIYPGSKALVASYLKPLPDQLKLHLEPENILFIGGGAYTAPKAVHERHPDMQIDVVEIEPKLYDLARQYFELPSTDKIKNHVSDARAYLNSTEKSYDYIYIDVFNSGHYLPPHLATQEFMQTVANHMTEDGILLINFVGKATAKPYASVTGSLIKTVQAVFPNTEFYATQTQNTDNVQNILVHAAKNAEVKTTLPPEDSIRLATAQPSFSNKTTFGELNLEAETLINDQDTPFTDNRNHLELLLAQDRW